VLGEIVRSGYRGWITVELYPYISDPDAAGRAAKQVLEQAAKQAGDVK
jgi:sugar phosphate isomerase/epimerase